MNMNYEAIEVRKSDYEDIRFCDPSTVKIGKYTLRYPSEIIMNDELMMGFQCLAPTGEITPVITAAEIIDGTELNDAGFLTFEDQFRKAMNAFENNFTVFYGSAFKQVPEQQLCLTGVMYDLQDALYYAVQDVKSSETEDVFQYFLGSQGYIWWADIVGVQKTIQLCREFFDKFYPLIQDSTMGL